MVLPVCIAQCSRLFIFSRGKSSKQYNQPDAIHLQYCQHKARCQCHAPISHDLNIQRTKDSGKKLRNLGQSKVSSRFDFKVGCNSLDKEVDIHDGMDDTIE